MPQNSMPHKGVCKAGVCLLVSALLASSVFAQNPPPPSLRHVTPEEARQAGAVAAAPTAAQKVQLLKEFIAAHPESAVRARLLAHVATSIERETDVAVRVSLAEKFSALAVNDTERAAAAEVLADSYLKANRVDDAFQTVAALPIVETVDIRLLANLAFAGAAESRQRNLRHLAASQKYGELAVHAIETNAIPAGMTAARWADLKIKVLPSLHQSLGLLALHAGTTADALSHFHKAIELAPDDAQNYVFLGATINEGYRAAAEQLKQLQPGPTRDDLARKVLEQLNQIVDAYAHAVALSIGTPQEEFIRTEIRPDLENYYKYLHKGALDGLQELIDKYKKQ